MGKICVVLGLAALLPAALFLAGCGAVPVFEAAEPVAVIEFQGADPTPTPSPTLSPTPSPTPTPAPTPSFARVGAVGDIMIMQSQVSGAWSAALSDYDFTPSFRAMAGVFARADLLCGNLETPLAGMENGGYSGPAPAAPTPNADGSIPKKELQTFNAPDGLARSLKAAGFSAITTANNHCLDRGAAGALRTVSVLRDAGLLQTGTYLSMEDRANAACIAEVNGIKVGLVGWTFSVNGYEGRMSADERAWLVGRTGDEAGMRGDIDRLKAAGAEFIIAFPHWDTEFQQSPANSTRRLAKWMLENGVDAILGSHPHVVQPIEYVSVERESGPYTGLVVFSMGNFISNMAPSPKDYGVYVELLLEKEPLSGEVRLAEAAYLPTLATKGRVEGRTLHEVLPAPEGSEAERKAAYEHVSRVCGDAIKRIAFTGDAPHATKRGA